ncbi:hypothetical protein E0198_000131 [Clavispora lusitaniae]|nr:hypothetical protein E0198_000131 [Clavispora lusitaniae]
MSSFKRSTHGFDSSSYLSNSSFHNSPSSQKPLFPNKAPSVHSSTSHTNLASMHSNTAAYGSESSSPPSSKQHPDPLSYEDHISTLNNISPTNIDYRTVGKHLVSPDESLKMQGGDVARYLYQQIENASKSSEPRDRRRTRSSSFSTFLSESRRESTASDINVPGGFRREFLINKSLQENKPPPNFVTRNFVEFLSIYGHFAGEDFTDEDDDESSFDEGYEDVFDEESSLLHERRGPQKRKKPKKHEQKGTASQLKVFFLLFKALVGSGILFLPGAFMHGGLLFSTITMVLFGVLTYACYVVLIKSKSVLGKSSFGELGYLTYGNPLKYCIMVSIILSQIGFVATYILFTAENMKSFIHNSLHISIEKSTLVIIQCILLIPLVLIRDLTKLSFTSLLSSAFIVIGLLIIFFFCGEQLAHEGLGPNIVQFNGRTWSMLIGVAVTAFEGIGLILPIQASMAQPEKFPFVLSMSMFVITLLFVSIGVIGYTSFGENVQSIIILNLPSGNAAVQSIMLLYSVAVFLTGPLQLFPAIRIGESALFNSRLFLTKEQQSENNGKLMQNSGKHNPHIKWMKNVLRSLSVVLISTVAYLNADNIDKFVSFNGCFACIPLVYIYPPMIHLKTYNAEPQQSKIIKVFDVLLIIVGTLAMVYTTYQILFSI